MRTRSHIHIHVNWPPATRVQLPSKHLRWMPLDHRSGAEVTSEVIIPGCQSPVFDIIYIPLQQRSQVCKPDHIKACRRCKGDQSTGMVGFSSLRNDGIHDRISTSTSVTANKRRVIKTTSYCRTRFKRRLAAGHEGAAAIKTSAVDAPEP